MTPRLAYIVLCHRLPEQVVRLVRRLQSGNTACFVHVDRRADDAVHDPIAAGVGTEPNVTLVERQPVRWGAFGHVAATLVALDAIAADPAGFDFVLLLTGQDYPLRSNDEIAAFLGANAGLSHLHAFRVSEVEASPWGEEGPGRYRRRHLHLGGRRVEVPGRRALPGGLEPYGGSAYWCLSSEAVAYVREFVDANPGFVRFFRTVASPEEMFFHTILLNSKLAPRVRTDVDYGVHFIDWSGRRSHPATLTRGDVDRLRASGQLFARKFDRSVDESVLDDLDGLARS